LRKQTILMLAAAMAAGAIGGAIFAPTPANAVAREIIELQQNVTQMLANQQQMQTQITQSFAVEKTLLDQLSDTVSKYNAEMATLQKSVQDLQANSGSRLDSMGTQVQGVSDNVADLQARIGKLDQKLTDTQNLLQSVDAKLAGNGPATSTPTPIPNEPPGGPPAVAPPAGAGGNGPTTSAPSAAPPPSADVLYSNALRDLTGKRDDLAAGEFTDYLKYYGDTDLASNAQFYLGEIAYGEGKYADAVAAYTKVIDNYPKSFKLASAHLKKGLALLELGEKTTAVRELRTVVRLYPKTDEGKRAAAKLKELGITS
jgi:tol-pal system protein YbgF